MTKERQGPTQGIRSSWEVSFGKRFFAKTTANLQQQVKNKK